MAKERLAGPYRVISHPSAIDPMRALTSISGAKKPFRALSWKGLAIGSDNPRVETTARYAHLARDSVKESTERIAVSIADDLS